MSTAKDTARAATAKFTRAMSDDPMVKAADALADALEGALAWEAETRGRLGLPQIDAPDWAQNARAALRAAGRL